MIANTANMNTDTKSGVVKWYNNKTGYGFITCDGSDVFVYHSSIVVDKEQFRYLVEGEYVIFCVEDRKGKSVAVNVRGVDGGRLMCETRNSVSRSTSDVSGKNVRRTGKSRDSVVDESVNLSLEGVGVKSVGEEWTSVVKG